MNEHELNVEDGMMAELERSLADASAWTGGETSLWSNALQREKAPKAWGRAGTWGMGIAAVLALSAGAVMLPQMWRSMGVASERVAEGARVSVDAAPPAYKRGYEEQVAIDGSSRYGYAGAPAQAPPETTPSSSTADLRNGRTAQATGQRYVVRRATMELTTRDVHAVFAKVGMVVNTALGEYVETSSISGDGQEARAEITLRVTQSRLSVVLNEVRGFGTIVSEQSGGQDITDQVVDVEARLRNEQRIEQELLTLLTSRKDASLEDVLRVQQELSRVREQIERMQAQRDSFARLADLATVLVIVRHETGQEQPPPNGFVLRVERAWERGIDDLGECAGGMLRIAVGGLPIWLIIGGAAYAGRRVYVRARQRRADEPAPKLGTEM